MKWRDHSNLEGLHAPFSASGHSWLNYDDEKFRTVYTNMLAKQKGTEDHEFAATCIKRKQKLPGSKINLSRYVNDAIGFKMSPEVILYYSENFFGTADAISFRKNPNSDSGYKYFLRIHDLKTGTSVAIKKLYQLQVYAALFFLEYQIDPLETEMELRVYQYGEIVTENPTAKEIKPIMDKIIRADKIIEELKSED